MVAEIIKRSKEKTTGAKKDVVDGKFDINSFKDINTTFQGLEGAVIKLVFQFSSFADLIDGQIIRLKRDRDLKKDPDAKPRLYTIERSRKSRVGMNTYLCSEVP